MRVIIDVFKKFPGIGSKSAERMAYQVLEMEKEKIDKMIEALKNAKEMYEMHSRSQHLFSPIEEYIKSKKENLVGAMESQGTTPRRLTDLIGSLCDLTSGSGDKGTPIVFIQGYFDNYTND